MLLSVCAGALVTGTGMAVAAPDPVALGQRLGQGVVNQTGADCRIVDNADNRCSQVDGRDISEAQISAYEQSWVHRALSLQRGLDADAPLIEEQLPHTHNTFNSSAYSLPTDGSAPSYYPTLTNQDPNQVYSISDQMNMDIRAIELDLHWVPSPYGTPATHGYWVTNCHGDGQQVPNTGEYVHIGCTYDRPAQDTFAEVRRWLDGHKDQFLLIYLENQLYDASPVADVTLAHNTAAKLLSAAFGPLVYKPTGTTPGRCATMPYSSSRAEMMATGARVLLVGNCGPGTWSSLVFQRGSTWDESGDPTAYTVSDCAKDRQLRASDSTFRREFEDSTFVSAATGSGPKPAMSPKNVADMTRCGVNIIGMDQLRPQDGRLAALVWSWAVNQPAAGGCAEQGADGRFRSADCDTALPAACLTGAQWSTTTVAVPWSDAAAECAAEFPGSTFTVPVNGYRDDLLRLAHPSQPAVWLNYARVGGSWTPNLSGPPSPTGSDGGGGRGHAYGRGHGTGRPVKP